MPPKERVSRKAKRKEDRLLTLDKIGESHSVDLCLSADYTRLTAKEAFRELAQNWRDGVLEVLDLDPEDFMTCIKKEVLVEHGTQVILFRALKPGSRPHQFGGFIRFRLEEVVQIEGRPERVGTVELTNFDRTLQPWHLNMGGTSKRDDSRSVGTHGEGANLAVLTMVQQATNLDVRYRSGGYSWMFEFNDNSTLQAMINRITDDPWADLNVVADEGSKRLVADPKTDMSVIIGLPASLMNEVGEIVPRARVREKDFITWLETTLFLQDIPDEQIVRTSAGSLLLDYGNPGKIFLKGFLLAAPDRQSATLSGKDLWFSYDFRKGKTNRDRVSLANAKSEAENIAKIWHHAIESKPALVEKLHDMLMSENSDQCADIHGSPAHFTKEMAIALKRHLLEKHGNKWFYSETEAKDPQTLQSIAGFDMEGLEVPKAYHAALKKAGVFRTVDEENKRRATGSPILQVTDMEPTRFAQEVYRIVKHLLIQCPWTDGAGLLIMQAGRHKLPLLLERMRRHPRIRFKVHEMWFDEETATRELGIELDTDRQAIFTVSVALFSEMINSLKGADMNVYRDGLRNGQRERNMRSEKAHWAKDVYVATSAKSITVETCQTAESALIVKWELPIEWRQDLDDPSSVNIEVQVHSLTDCGLIRWDGPTTYLQDNGPAGCTGHGCWCLSGNGLMNEAVVRIANSTKRYYAVIINLSEPTCVPLISEEVAIPHQGPVVHSDADVPEPPLYKCGERLGALTLHEPKIWYSAVGHSNRSVVIGKSLVKQELGDDDEKIHVKKEFIDLTEPAKKRKLGSFHEGEITMSPFSSKALWEF